MIKRLIKYIFLFPTHIFNIAFQVYEKIISGIFPQLNGALRQPFINYVDNDKKLTLYDSTSFYLYTPNDICNFRHSTFSSKEPEMLNWIEEYGGGVFFDIGANIGIYSLYYTQAKDGNVYSFEPSVFNLRQLAKNISINKVSDRISIIPNPLSDVTGINLFKNGSMDEGGALSAFGVEYGFDNMPIESNINYSIMGFSLDDLFDKNVLKETPSLIKIDVDGIEHLILKGASKTLQSDSLKSIFIEVNDEFEEQSSQVKAVLEATGFKLKDKHHAEMFRKSTVFNQIWIKQ